MHRQKVSQILTFFSKIADFSAIWQQSVRLGGSTFLYSNDVPLFCYNFFKDGAHRSKTEFMLGPGMGGC